MPAPLQLQLTDYLDPTRWRWVLSDERGRFLADHTVRLDPTSRDYGGFLDLRQYLDYHTPIVPPEQQLADLGRWIGEEVFGGLRTVLWQRRALPALTIQVNVPPVAQELLFRPFELACFADGKPFRAAGIRFVYTLTGAAAGPEAKEPPAQALRILAAFSLPVAANPLNLRRERYGLQQLVRTLNQTQGLAVELRVLQYGATRDHLQAALEDGDGWDIIQLSGHGAQGELLLEDAHGGSATIDADALGDLLDLARARLRLLILDACSSGAGSHAAARAQVGLETLPLRQEGAAGNESKRQLDPTYVMTVAPPAAAEGILAVAALQSAGAPHDQLTVAPFSNSGALLAAPGVAIHSARAGGGYTRLSGTSMASPHVTGVAALWAERQLQQSGQVNIPMLAAQVQGNATRHRLAQPSDPLDVGAGLVGAPPG